MTTDITELAQLRAELSNPAVGSKDHLRKLALSLVEALEKAQTGEKQWREVVDAFCADDADWHKLTNSNNELIALLSQALCKQADRIAELESRTVKLPPKIERDDADVSDRNQPGMVVAVHIDAGDFLKFRDQVYEVKETDFDDHDVTLWFVGGEALKCAAGCLIEVVSAPEETE